MFMCFSETTLELETRSEYDDEESLAGSQIDLLQKSRSDKYNIGFSNTNNRSVTNIDIF